MTIPISAQIAEIEREIRSRERYYPNLVERGRLTKDTAERKLRELRAAALSLHFLSDNRDWIIAVWKQRKMMDDVAADENPIVPPTADPAPQDAELTDAQRAVMDPLLDTFPGAQVADIRAKQETEPAT